MSRSELDQMIELARFNPAAVKRSGIAFLEKVTAGEVEITDPSNAFTYLMEFSATLFANAARKDELLTRYQYPELAMTRDELYRHMADVDYVGIFGSPSLTTLLMVYNEEEVLARAVDTGLGGVRKLTIPRYTQVSAGEVPFTLMYPIDLRVMPHGAIEVVYDSREKSPLQELETNKVPFTLQNYNIDRTRYIQLEVPAYQLEVRSYKTPMSAARIFSKTYAYSDQFHYCRVYHRVQGTWVEMKTTHSDQVYDPNTPTAVMKLLDRNQLNVSIPQVYFTNQSVRGEVRVDIFTTRGALELDVQNMPDTMFKVKYSDLDVQDGGRYTTPLLKMMSGYFMAGTKATGGTNAMDFDKLKARMISNALSKQDLPITNVQIQSRLDMLTDIGFSSQRVIDNTIKRLYATTRELPKPDIAEISTGIGAAILPLNQTMDTILATGWVKDNGQRITILPENLYKDEGGYLTLVPRQEVAALRALRGDVLVDRVSSTPYLYTPFHYVYDVTDNVFKVRPYYFGAPKITRRFFVEENGSYGVGLTVNDHLLERTPDGWSLTIRTRSSDPLREMDDDAVAVQLAFIPAGEITRVYKNGEYLGRDPETNERMFRFTFESDWDVDGNNNVSLIGFESAGVSPRAYAAGMSTQFDIFYAVREALVEGGERTKIDDTMGSFLFADDMVGLYHEQLTMTLGYSLDGLWVRARSSVSDEQYLRHEQDVYRTHQSNIPARDTNGAVVITYVDGKPQVVYEHRAGDPVLENGNPVILHRAGEVILVNGQPLVGSPRKVLRQVELCLFDGTYYFVSAQTDLQYRETAPVQIVEWVNNTLAPVRAKLLENTVLMFHPKATVGQIEATVDNGLKVNIQAAQKLRVEYFVSDTVARNDILKESIRRRTRELISEAMDSMQVTRNGVEDALERAIGDIISVRVSGLGNGDYSVITLANDSMRMCIGKKLVQFPNATFGVEDNIEIIFSRHGV